MPSATDNQSTLPTPETFDLIPSLHTILARLLPSSDPAAPPPLSPKDLATEAAAVKIQIQKARALVESLPDVDRTVQEQEQEIQELEERIRAQKAVLRRIGEAGRI